VVSLPLVLNVPDNYDPQEPGVTKRVRKSGSFLCGDQYRSRYLVGSRGKRVTDSGSSNVGFRHMKGRVSAWNKQVPNPKGD
jgi:hypothetical protein